MTSWGALECGIAKAVRQQKISKSIGGAQGQDGRRNGRGKLKSCFTATSACPQAKGKGAEDLKSLGMADRGSER